MPRSEREKWPRLDEWAVAWRRLYDDFDKLYRADPMIVYRPKHRVAYEFHSSPAFIRYFRAGNRTSKTQSGYAEHYFHATGRHPYNPSRPAGHTFIIGLEYSKYAPNVFERKMLTGEAGNPISPMFPEDGKWFHHYDDRKKILRLGCKECAEAGKAKACRHQKWSVSLFSDEVGWEQLQGARYVFGHFDEHLDEGWLDESQVRLVGVKGAGLAITGSPIFGPLMWENTRVAAVAEENPSLNRQDPNNPDSPPLVSIHQISMRDAGIASKEDVARLEAGWDEMKIRARIEGLPAPTTDNPVFDPHLLAEALKKCRAPKYGTIREKKPLEDVQSAADFELEYLPAPFKPKEHTGLRIWEDPDPNGQYIAAVDSARGITGRDASCCSILRLENRDRRLHMTLVAQYYGWLNGFDYGTEVYKLCIMYASALAVVELTGGFGDAVVLRLKQLAYWNIYRETGKKQYADFVEDARFGIDTNASTKPFMVTALQQFVRERCISIYCRDTIEEMMTFTQEDFTKEGERLVSPRFRGAGGTRDDRVMSLVIGSGVAVSNPIFDFQADVTGQEMAARAGQVSQANLEDS